ncbi:hypothetical protein [Sphingomonas adhaesiva]|uniref:hypothetical protein n=1 Tax=Sphingomonas adhaesiva TaxID=28212 RepID=UPI002FF4BA7B
MIAVLLLAAAFQDAPSPTPPAPSADTWAALPQLQFRRPGVDIETLVRFVRGEVEAGRCPAATVDTAGTTVVRAPVAVLVAPDGSVRRLVPAAIDCPTVEQFTVGVIGRLAAGNVRAPWPAADRWYRTGITYNWSGAPAAAPLPSPSPDAR